MIYHLYKKNRDNSKLLVFAVCVIILFIISCNKDEFLEKKPSTNIIVPTTLSDFQNLLDNYNVINQTPALGEMAADDYYLTYASWQALTNSIERNNYKWQKDIYEGLGNISDWNIPYQQIFYANVVLEGLKKMNNDYSTLEANIIKGSALFIRAYAYFNLAQHFATVYDSNTAVEENGIPLKYSSDISEVSPRASLASTYNQIISDLTEAKQTLPLAIPINYRNRPSKPAVYALLARVFLSMREFDKAFANADSCLKIYNTLIDYNIISTTSITPFLKNNDETIYQSNLISTYSTLRAVLGPAIIDSNLYQSYSNNDLRKSIFFRISGGNPAIKGGYNGTVNPFSGLATDEMYLIRSECFARANNVSAAMNDLNTLLIKRWKTGLFVPMTALNSTDALSQILKERRKELIFRGLRWIDLRRLNKESSNINVIRSLNGQIYSLPPNSSLYTLPIPQDEVSLSGISQNVRN